MKYVLYEGDNGDILFTRETIVEANKKTILAPFTNKTPTWTVESDDDGSAITLLNAHMLAKSVQK